MKKLLLLLLASFMLTACSEKDKNYYINNIDEAEKKVQQCTTELEEAFLTNNKEKLVKLKKDPECLAAREAVREDKISKAEQALLLKETERKKAILEAKEKLLKEYGNTNWKLFAQSYVNTECAKKWFVGNDDYSCIAFREIYQDKVKDAKAELTKIPFVELFNQEKSYCAKDKRPHSVCDIWEKTLNEQAEEYFEQMELKELNNQETTYCDYKTSQVVCSTLNKIINKKHKEVVSQYVKDYELLKRDYNQCVMQIKNVKNNYIKQSKIMNSYPCKQTKSARMELSLPYDDFKTLME
ncbi:hypothetical protein ACFQ02_03300 [Seminibacterium arietis]|uniref:Lipoprotein n=1 Tax=Seminibacterium arietis TaxID=1173502 RepID=A0ABW3I882_9PAST